MSSNATTLWDSTRADIAQLRKDLLQCSKDQKEVNIVISKLDGFSTLAPAFAAFFRSLNAHSWKLIILDGDAHVDFSIREICDAIDAVENGNAHTSASEDVLDLLQKWTKVAEGKRK
jgi:hypothetical protein